MGDKVKKEDMHLVTSSPCHLVKNHRKTYPEPIHSHPQSD